MFNLSTTILKRKSKLADKPRCSEQKPDRLELDYPACIAEQYPHAYPFAKQATDMVLAAIEGQRFTKLAKNSPSLANFDWAWYIKASLARVTIVLDQILNSLPPPAHVLDMGAYFGNFAIACKLAGYKVTALDSFTDYSPDLDELYAQMQMCEIELGDYAEIDYSLSGLAAGQYDAVLSLGVIEHVPHTPRPLLEAVKRVLKPGGLLVLETPNLAYLYKREKLMAGESVFAPIDEQYFTDIPFMGHHREYTKKEIQWLVEQIGFREINCCMYNYSYYGLPYLAGKDLEKYYAMLEDPEKREIILSVSIKPHEFHLRSNNAATKNIQFEPVLPTAIDKLSAYLKHVNAHSAMFKSIIDRVEVNGKAFVLFGNDKVQYFRDYAQDLIVEFDQCMFDLWKSAPRPTRVSFVNQLDEQRGLSEDELTTLFERWIAIDSLQTFAIEDGKKLTLLSGLLRKELFAVFLDYPDNKQLSVETVKQKIDVFFYHQMSPVFVLLALEQLAQLTEADLARLSEYLHSREVAVAVKVSDAPNSLRNHQELDLLYNSFTEKLPGVTILPVLYMKNVQIYEKSTGFADLVRQSKFKFDLNLISLPMNSDSKDKVGPYLGLSPYYPFDFDMRIPSYIKHDDDLIVSPFIDYGEFQNLVSKYNMPVAFLRNRTQISSQQLVSMLSFNKLEKYLQSLDESYLNYQMYHLNRVYNRADNGSTYRVSAIRVDLSDDNHCDDIVDWFNKTQRYSSYGVEIIDSKKFADSLITEADSYILENSKVALDDQVKAHEYLNATAGELELREEVKQFAEFIGNDLGITVELGSGYGLLAKKMADKSEKYICIDLQLAMLKPFNQHNIISGVIADAHHLPILSNTVDTFIANNILEHLYDPVTSLQEIVRILKPGGKLFALIPLEALNSEYDLPAHLWKADRLSIRHAFADAGLKIDVLEDINLYQLKITGSFPSCHGIVCRIKASKPMRLK